MLIKYFRTYVKIDTRLYFEYKKKMRQCRRLLFVDKLIESAALDGVYPEEMDDHDEIFKPENEAEKEFWEICRASAKHDRIARANMSFNTNNPRTKKKS